MPKAGKTPRSLRDQIADNLPKRKATSFESTLSPDLLSELRAIRDDWRAGLMTGVSKSGLAKAVARVLADRGVSCHASTVTRWLEA